MKLRISLIIYTAFHLSSQIASGQYYDTGQDPASLKWLQIKTGRFTVIYPENYEKGGQIYAKILDNSYMKLMSLFPEKKFTLPVVIHNYSIRSNGYVAWAPRRMELYPTPEQNTIPLLPEKQLAIHELTHVLQMESLNSGFSKGMSLLFGEQFTGVVSSLLPIWFLEGDAVFSETALTQSGRGRDASFQKHLKAILIDGGKKLSYDRILNGSYKDFIPDNYESGFQMVALALTKNDPQIWNKVLNYAAAKPFTINPVNISLKRIAGFKKRTLWAETSDTLRNIWTRDFSREKPDVYPVSTPEKNGRYISYFSPVFAASDSIFAVKSSLSSPASFVLINPVARTEKKIHTPGQIYPKVISYSSGKLLWIESQPDPRWMNRSYSVIKLLDIKLNRIKKLSHKTRYLAAAVSPEGKRIIVIENTVNNTNKILLIDTETGGILRSLNTPDNIYLQHPQWASDGKKVTSVFLSDGGEGIISFNTENCQWETLVEAGKDNLQSSILRNDSLYFISSASGTDNIYLRTPDKEVILLTHSRFGTTDITSGGNNLYFSDYSFNGNNVCTIPASSPRIKASEERISSSFLINRFNIKPTNDTDSSTMIYSPVRYRKWKHLFRFHSWMPIYADIEEIKSDPGSIRPGFTVMTQNTLSTLTSTIAYEYTAEKNHLFHSRITWKGWCPVIESQVDYGSAPRISKMGDNVSNPSDIMRGIRFINTASMPLEFSSGRFSQYIRPSVEINYVNNYVYIREHQTYDYGQTIITGRLYFSNYDRFSIRDIYPKWAQTIDLHYSYAPFDKTIYGSSLSVKTAFFIPGFLPNNGIKIRLESEKQDPQKYLYGNFSSFPRGYMNLVSKKIKFLSIDYVMPIAYPDFNIGGLMYLKRLRTGFFYDYAAGPGNSFYKYSANGLVPLFTDPEKKSFKSFGIELLADCHILRIPFMISGGIRSAWRNFNETPITGLIINIDLFGMTLGRRSI